MGSFDFAPDRPPRVEEILSGLDRYNPETTGEFKDYVTQQCEEGTYDCYANLALLKLYQFNPHLSSDETITNILVKALTVFPTPDFSLCLHLLPPHILHPASTASSLPAAGDAPLSEAVQKLTTLNQLLSEAKYKEFWSTLESDDLYADLTADVSGFEELMRVRIAVVVGQSCKEIERSMMESWLKLKGAEFEKFIAEICGWGLDTTRPDARGGMIVVPESKENQARSTVIRENVQFDQFARVIRRAYEQPA